MICPYTLFPIIIWFWSFWSFIVWFWWFNLNYPPKNRLIYKCYHTWTSHITTSKLRPHWYTTLLAKVMVIHHNCCLETTWPPSKYPWDNCRVQTFLLFKQYALSSNILHGSQMHKKNTKEEYSDSVWMEGLKYIFSVSLP